MLWFYGGSWSLGSGSVPIYDGSERQALRTVAVPPAAPHTTCFALYVTLLHTISLPPPVFDVALEEDVIIATINYRLAVFGFLSGQPLIDEAADRSTGNYGFQDQRAAMQFLHDTATAFGGNPNRVTIFGESAGAGSVSDHLVAPRSWPLFHGAIMESTGAADW